jgi:stage II sporulation protein D
LVISLFPLQANALQNKNYNNPVNVSIQNTGSFDIVFSGIYELTNLSTNAKALVSNRSVSVKKTSNGITLSDGIYTYSSINGFKLLELVAGQKVASFTSDTHVRKGATGSYDSISIIKKGATAYYNSSFINGAGETWFNVTTNDGHTGWVSSTTTLLIDTVALPNATVGSNKYRGSFEILPNGSNAQAINQLDMEDYLKGVVPNEMSASWHMEALKAQAIAARSYAQNSMVLSDTARSQVYRGLSSEHSRSNQAIEETAGLTVKYNGKTVQTFFFSTSGGKTANVSDVWNSNQNSFPYLTSVVDEFEHQTAPASLKNWSYTYDKEQVLKSFGLSNTAELYNVIAHPSGKNGEVKSVTVHTSLGDKTISGSENTIRRLFPVDNSAYYNLLLSNWFTVSLNKQVKSLQLQTASTLQNLSTVKGQVIQTNLGNVTQQVENASVMTNSGVISTQAVESVVVNGKGWGHRVGMSQYGAKAYAENGWKAEQILTHYFQGTTVSK